jgi:hypothetical protein
MKNKKIKYADDWRTPPEFYTKLNNLCKFDFDPFPWYHDTSEWSGLNVEWGQSNYVNPPYSDDKSTGYLKTSSIKKAIEERNKGKFSLFTIPVSTSTRLFHDYIKNNMLLMEFVRGRLPFIGINSKGQHVNFHLLRDVDNSKTIEFDGELIKKYVKNSGQHDSMVVCFGSKEHYNKYNLGELKNIVG